MDTEQDKKPKTRKKFKKRYWLLIDLAVVIFIFVLLLYTPSGYNPAAGNGRGRVHPYLMQLSSEFYNGAQLQEPFKVVVIDEKLTEAIAGWSQASPDTVLSAPAVRFVPDCIELMGTATLKGVELVITIVLQPEIDQDGLLNLKVDKVKTGAVNITPLAKMVARKMYEQHIAGTTTGPQDWRAQLAASVLDGRPFDPVFPIEDKKVRLEKVDIQKGKLELRLTPVP
jgi:uncharacterized protein YpmS